MDKEQNKSRMPQIGEAMFCIVYLVFDLIAAIVFFVNANGSQSLLLFGVLTLVLGGGDAFHLVPRVIKAFGSNSSKVEWWSGLGLMVSSITMTVFYVLLFYVWKAVFPEISYSSLLPVLGSVKFHYRFLLLTLILWEIANKKSNDLPFCSIMSIAKQTPYERSHCSWTLYNTYFKSFNINISKSAGY